MKVADTPAQLMAAVDVACTCVATPAALEQVVAGKDGLLSAARRGQLLIDFSTIGPEQARSLEQRAAAVGVDFVEAPVTGSKNGAEKGTLLIMAGATATALSRAEPVFRAVGEKWIHCGPVGAGSQVKLAGNALIAAMLQAFGEGMLLAARAGVDPAKVLEVVQASGFRSPYFEFKGQALLRRDFETHFAIDLMHKDLGLFLDSAAALPGADAGDRRGPPVLRAGACGGQGRAGHRRRHHRLRAARRHRDSPQVLMRQRIAASMHRFTGGTIDSLTRRPMGCRSAGARPEGSNLRDSGGLRAVYLMGLPG